MDSFTVGIDFISNGERFRSPLELISFAVGNELASSGE